FDYTCRPDAAIDLDREPFLRPLIAHRQALQLLPIGAPVEDKIVAPHLVGAIGSLGARASAGDTLAAALLRQPQQRYPPEAVRAAKAHVMAIAVQEDRDPPIAVTRILQRQLDHPLEQRCIPRRQARTIAKSRARYIHQRA